jgi:predicted metal-dependent hydrolase
MVSHLELGDVVLDVVKKDIKNVHLSVYPPTGRVRISAPLHMSTDTIRVFAISKLPWIRQQQKKLQAQEREGPRAYIDRESHYLWGKRYLLKLVPTDAAPSIELKHTKLMLHIRPDATTERKEAVLDEWYREQLKAALPALLAKWQRVLGVEVSRFFVQRMKTKWGGCSPATRTLRLNSELAKKPPECLEYIVVHELMHLIEPTHNAHFVALMDLHMPKWRHYREILNNLPVRAESWGY